MRTIFILILALLLGCLIGSAVKACDIAFLHHSVGRNLIIEGEMRGLIDGQLWDHDYNLNCGSYTGVTDPSGTNLGYDWDIPGNDGCGNTDPDGLNPLFSLPSAARDSLLEHDVIVVKSCYGANEINSQGDLNALKANYLSMAASMAVFSEKRFIVCSPPPLHRMASTSAQAARARELANWLPTVAGPNIWYFNLYEYLAGIDDFLHYDYERWHSYPDSHPNTYANLIVSAYLAELINDVCDPNTGVQPQPDSSWGSVKRIWR